MYGRRLQMHIFFSWIQKQLTRKDILCQSLEMPLSYDPIYSDHERVLNQMEISHETTLVGHSCGGGFLLRYFSKHKEKSPRKIILVAPWLDLESRLKKINPASTYFDFSIDLTLTTRTNVQCMYSTDDDSDILNTVERIRQNLSGVTYSVFSDKGHFTEPDLGSKEFPELLEIIEMV